MRIITVTCDDAGLSAGINQSIQRLYTEEWVTTASILTNYPYLAQMSDLVKTSGIAHGIHFNLTDGKAISALDPRNGLIDPDRNFRGLHNLLRLALFPTQDFLDDVRQELNAQLEAYFAVGIRPLHISTHQHFHVMPSLRAIIEDLYAAHTVEWIRTPDLFRAAVPLPFSYFFLKKQANHTSSIPYLDHVIDLNTWRLTSTPEALAKTILRLRGKIELVVHPSEVSDETYPPRLSNPPIERHKQALFLKEVLVSLCRYDSEFLLTDISARS